MELTFELWYLFPAAIAISTVAMASGVGGAIFFSPLFILVLGLDAQVAIGTALLTELFGFSSGVSAYWRSKLIDFKLGKSILKWSIPAAIVGVLLSSYIPSNILKGLFAIGILYIGYRMYASWKQEEREKSISLENHDSMEHYESEIIDNKGTKYRYTVCNRKSINLFATIGGWFVGLISVGLGELMDYHLVSRCKVPTPVAVATAVFSVVVTVLIASAGHMYEFFFNSPPEIIQQVLGVVAFTIPGVLIGGQIGPQLQKVLPEKYLKVGLSLLFIGIGILMSYALLVS
ncbi:MAG: sulfite exporter TauE/SafE family protein [Allomuricauda sp.]